MRRDRSASATPSVSQLCDFRPATASVPLSLKREFDELGPPEAPRSAATAAGGDEGQSPVRGAQEPANPVPGGGTSSLDPLLRTAEKGKPP